MSPIETVLENPIVAQFLGLAVGLFTSFFSWWVLFHWLSPKLEITDHIARQPALSPEEPLEGAFAYRYRFKLRNTGRRAIVDLQVRVSARIRGVANSTSGTWQVVHLPMHRDGERVFSSPRIDPHQRSKTNLVLPLYTHNLEDCKYAPFSLATREAALRNGLTIEDLLKTGALGEIRVFVSGYDEFSGSRKVFSFTFASQRIAPGSFAKDSMRFIPEPSTDETNRAHSSSEDRISGA